MALGIRQQQALAALLLLVNQEWRAGCFIQFWGKETPPFLKLSNGQQDKILWSLAVRGLVRCIGEDQYGMGIYRL